MSSAGPHAVDIGMMHLLSGERARLASAGDAVDTLVNATSRPAFVANARGVQAIVAVFAGGDR